MSSAPSRRAASHRTQDTIPQELALLACGVALAPFGDAVQIVDLRNLFRSALLPMAPRYVICLPCYAGLPPSPRQGLLHPEGVRGLMRLVVRSPQRGQTPSRDGGELQVRAGLGCFLLSANMPGQCSCFLGLECVSMLLQSESNCSLGNLLNVCFKLLQR